MEHPLCELMGCHISFEEKRMKPLIVRVSLQLHWALPAHWRQQGVVMGQGKWQLARGEMPQEMC